MKKEKISIDFIETLKRLELKEDFECGEPQNDIQIEHLETTLNLKFPLSYKEFLKKYGYVAFFGGHIFGPSNNPIYDLITRNQEARGEQLPKDFSPLPLDAFVIDNYAGGGYFMLYCQNSSRKGEVGLFIDEMRYQEVQSWHTFQDYLVEGYCSERYI